MTVADSAVKKIVDTPGPDTDPQWSPDGKQIAYVTSNGEQVFLLHEPADRGGGCRWRNAARVDASFDEDPDLLRVGARRAFISQALQKTSSSLFLLDPGKRNSASRWRCREARSRGQFTFSKDFKQVAYRGAGANEYRGDLLAALARRLACAADASGEQLRRVHGREAGGGALEVRRWTRRSRACCTSRRIFDATKKYPLLVVIHGGPTGIDMPVISPDRYYPIERFVAKGALVLRPNYRGSAGYGEKFRSLNVRNLGVGDYADVISGVDSLIAQGFRGQGSRGVDGMERGRLHFGVHHHIERPVQGGVRGRRDLRLDDLLREHRHHAVHAAVSARDAVGRSGDLPEDVADQLHREGEDADTDSAGQRRQARAGADSFELRQALEDHGVPVKMVVYDGFGHPINKPKQQRAVMEENENWFGHYIWGDPLAPALTPRPSEKKDDKDAKETSKQ